MKRPSKSTRWRWLISVADYLWKITTHSYKNDPESYGTTGIISEE